MKWICVAPASYLNWSCQGEWDPDSVLFSREKLLGSSCSVKCWLHLCAPSLADFCKEKMDKIWHDPYSFPTGLSCLSPGSDVPSFACLLLSPPEHLPLNPSPCGSVGIFIPPLPASQLHHLALFSSPVFAGSLHSAYSCTLTSVQWVDTLVQICCVQYRKGGVCVS